MKLFHLKALLFFCLITATTYAQQVEECQLTMNKTDVTCFGANNGTATATFLQPNKCRLPEIPTVSCTSGCTRTITDNTSFTVSPGEKVCLLTINYSGTISLNGGELIVCGSIGNTGSVSFSSTAGSTFVNLNSVSVRDININSQSAILKNYGTMDIAQGMSFSSKIENHGTLTVGATLSVNSHAELYNTGTVIAKNTFQCSNLVNNYGTINAKLDLKLAGGTVFNNYCTVIVGTDVQNTGQVQFRNSGTVTINGTLKLGGGSTLIAHAGSEIVTGNLVQSGSIQGIGEYCSSLRVLGTISGNANISGLIKVCKDGDTACICDVKTCTYSWTNESLVIVGTTQTITGLAPGRYQVQATCGVCRQNGSVTILEPSELKAQIALPPDHPNCFGSSDGNIDLSVEGGTGPSYSYLWSNGATTQDLSNVPAGTYSVTVTDGNNCVKQTSATLIEPSQLSAAPITDNPNCFDATDGSIYTNVSGGTQITDGPQPYNYQWSNGATTADLTNKGAGTYTVLITDAQGCTLNLSFDLTEPPLLVPTITLKDDPNCYQGTDGSAQLSVAGGTAPYTYSWNTTPVQTTRDLFNVGKGTYQVTVTDAQGCVATTSVTIDEPPLLVPTITSKDDPNCYQGTDGSAQLSVAGGTAPYTYSWNTTPVQTTRDLFNVGKGTYQVTVTDAQGCVATTSVTIDEPPLLVPTITSKDDPNCYQGTDGSAQLSVAGGTAPYTYSWNTTPVQTTRDLFNVGKGTYQVTVTDAQGCVATTSVTIDEPALLVATITSQSNVVCNGTPSGSAQLGVTGGTAPYTYLWSDGSTAQNLSGVKAGTYTVTVTDAQNCTATTSVTITQPALLLASVRNKGDVFCHGGSNGYINMGVRGGVQPYTYSWSNGATTQNLSGLAAGTYTLTVTDAQGCIATASASITQPEKLVGSLVSTTNVSCFGGTDGTVTISVTGGTTTSPYNFSWSNGATTQNLANVPAGSYTVTITDANLCTTTVSATVTQPQEALSVTVTNFTDVTCKGAGDGTVDIQVQGGTSPYTYSWSNGSTLQNLRNAQPGNHVVIVTDAKGCTTNANETIEEPAKLTAEIFQTKNVSCSGGGDGEIRVTIAGGTEPYTYTWSNGGSTKDISGLTVGTYSLTVKDYYNCTATVSATITQPTQLTGTITSSTNVSCNGGSDGTATAEAGGGTGPYTYTWSNGVVAQTVNTLTAGTHTVTIKDANNCEVQQSVTITEPPVLTASIDGTHVSCKGGMDGTITLTPGGGTAPYSYLWNDNNTSQSRTALTAGTYSVTITDAKGCLITKEFTITQPEELVATLSGTTNVACYGGATGGASVTASGGTSPYTYTWSNGMTGFAVTGLTAGSYTVVVADSKGCNKTVTVEITQPALLTVTMDTKKDVSCFGGNDGNITITAAGGVAPYQYAWSNGATTDDITALRQGTYDVTVTDANGCTVQTSVVITEPPVLTATTSSTNVLCFGLATGAVSVTPAGGTEPYTYIWNNGATTATVENLLANTYSVVVTDAKNCTIQKTVIVTQPNKLVVTATKIDVSCSGRNDGSAAGVANGGVASYNYLWSTGETTSAIYNLAPGTYTVTGTDQNGCTESASITIGEQNPITLSITGISPVSCSGGSDGGASVVVNGGNEPYSFSWSGGATQQTATNLRVGEQSVTVTDSKNCSVTATAVIPELPSLTVTAQITDVNCYGGSTGAATLTVAGGTTPYTYAWTNGQNVKDLSSVVAGTYTVVVTDNKNCTANTTVSINQPASPLTPLASSDPVTCPGGTDGDLSVSISGGTAPYSTSWSNGFTGENAAGVPAGDYTVTVTDALGCVSTAMVTVYEPVVDVRIMASGTSICPGGTYSLTLTAASAPEGYTYLWSTGETARTIIVTEPATYSVQFLKATCAPLTASVDILLSADCNTASFLCAPELPPTLAVVNSCKQQLVDIAYQNAKNKFEAYIAAEKKNFQQEYIAKCLKAYEEFEMTYEDKEHHYTLYYYDQAGNLLRTVPPAGVKILPAEKLAQVKIDREENKRTVFTEHDMATTYTYNSLNQLVSQDVPDHHQMRIWEAQPSSNGIPADLSVFGTQFINEDKGYLIAGNGTEGHIYTTVDGGKTWSKLTALGLTDLSDIQFSPDGSTAFAVGNSGTFLRSDNAGTTWSVKPVGSLNNLTHVWFFDNLSGYVFDASGNFWATTDGGNNWSGIANNLSSVLQGQLKDIHFAGTRGYAVSRNVNAGSIYVSDDQGVTWTSSSAIATTDLKAVEFIGMTGNGFAAGVDGNLLRTANYGQTWTSVPTDFIATAKEIHFQNTSTGVILADNGSLYSTTNGGLTWTTITTPSIAQDIYFSSPTNGYAVTTAGQVYKTTNGGQSWSSTGISAALAQTTSVFFDRTETSRGYVAGTGAELKFTNNGGAAWTAISTSAFASQGIKAAHFESASEALVLLSDNTLWYSININAVSPQVVEWTQHSGTWRSFQFTDAATGYGVQTDGSVYRTFDGGQSFAPMTGANVSLAGLTGLWFSEDFSGQVKAYAVGDNGRIDVSSGGVTSWSSKAQSVIPSALNGIQVTTSGTGYAAGQGGSVWHTSDHGSTWQELSTGHAMELNALSIIPSTSNVVFAGQNGTVRTYNGAFATSGVPSGFTAHLKNIVFASNGVGYATGTDGKVLTSINSGATWSETTAGSTQLNGVSMSSAGHALVAGNSGGIYRRLSGATSWTEMNQREPLNLTATQMANETTGYAVGANGTVVKTTDGGTAWSVMSTGVSNDFHGLYFNNASTGIVIGSGGLILRTTNGGSSWTPVSSGTTATLRDAYILSDGLGLIVGDGGTVLRSTNTGESWGGVSLGFSTTHLNAVYSIDNTTAYAVGDDGTIIRGTNSGTNWEKLLQTNGSTWTNEHLRDVWFRDYVTGYAIGDNGTVLKTNERGETWETETINSNADLRAITFTDQNNAFIGGADGSLVKLDDQSDKISSRFWYDRLGRLVVSQNAKQYNYSPNGYSYTKYDALGRIAEVGEILTSTQMSDAIAKDESALTAWTQAGTRREITRTYYDIAQFSIPGFVQENLRTRVASTTYQDVEGIAYDHATHYSYDVHGNVKTVIQDFPELENISSAQSSPGSNGSNE